jgi:hypothetical protein
MAMVLTLAQMAKVPPSFSFASLPCTQGQLRMSRTIRILTVARTAAHAHTTVRARARQEWLENIKDELARKAREREERARLQEYEEEQAQQIIQERKFQAGTPVNPTTFAGASPPTTAPRVVCSGQSLNQRTHTTEWKAKFELETKSSKLRTATEEEKRLSGLSARPQTLAPLPSPTPDSLPSFLSSSSCHTSGRQLFEIDASLFAYDDIDEEELPEF